MIEHQVVNQYRAYFYRILRYLPSYKFELFPSPYFCFVFLYLHRIFHESKFENPSVPAGIHCSVWQGMPRSDCHAERLRT